MSPTHSKPRRLLRLTYRATLALLIVLWLPITAFYTYCQATRVANLPTDNDYSEYCAGNLYLDTSHLQLEATHNHLNSGLQATLSLDWRPHAEPRQTLLTTSWQPAGDITLMDPRCGNGPQPTTLLSLNRYRPTTFFLGYYTDPATQQITCYSSVIALQYFDAVLTLPAIAIFLIITRHLVHRTLLKPPPPGLCPTCHYDLRASPHQCPECGTLISPLVPPTPTPPATPEPA